MLGSSGFAPFSLRSLSLQALFHTCSSHVPSSRLLGCTWLKLINDTRFPTNSFNSDISALSCRWWSFSSFDSLLIPSSKAARCKGEGECEPSLSEEEAPLKSFGLGKLLPLACLAIVPPKLLFLVVDGLSQVLQAWVSSLVLYQVSTPTLHPSMPGVQTSISWLGPHHAVGGFWCA